MSGGIPQQLRRDYHWVILSRRQSRAKNRRVKKLVSEGNRFIAWNISSPCFVDHGGPIWLQAFATARCFWFVTSYG
jgi:hypothetical protein